MRSKIFRITDTNVNRVFFEEYMKQNGASDDRKARMKNILSLAIKSELTEKQRLCLTDFYLNGKKEKEIAMEQNLNPSTVSRHITSAKRKLMKIASYYS